MAFKMKGFMKENPKSKEPKKFEGKDGDHVTYGLPDFLYNADGKKLNTANIDEGNLSVVKTESGTDRKYVTIRESSVAGGAGSRLYLKLPK